MVVVKAPIRVRAARLIVQLVGTILAFRAALLISNVAISIESAVFGGSERRGAWNLSYVCVVVSAGAGGRFRAAGDEALARVPTLLQQPAAVRQADREAGSVGHCRSVFCCRPRRRAASPNGETNGEREPVQKLELCGVLSSGVEAKGREGERFSAARSGRHSQPPWIWPHLQEAGVVLTDRHPLDGSATVRVAQGAMKISACRTGKNRG